MSRMRNLYGLTSACSRRRSCGARRSIDWPWARMVMENFLSVALLFIGLALGASAVWLILRSRVTHAQILARGAADAEIASLAERARQHEQGPRSDAPRRPPSASRNCTSHAPTSTSGRTNARSSLRNWTRSVSRPARKLHYWTTRSAS